MRYLASTTPVPVVVRGPNPISTTRVNNRVVDTSKLFWTREDLVNKYSLTVDFDQLDSIRKERNRWLERECWKEVCRKFEELKGERLSPCPFDASQSHVRVSGLSSRPGTLSLELVEALHPWRKGPFQIAEHEIDAEWRSDQKWDRIAPRVG